jgi:hypothetical protein
MPISKEIALLFDCDGTISEDTTTCLLRKVGLKPTSFWGQVRKMEGQGWEPTLTFMKLLIDFAQKNKKKKLLTKQLMRDIGKRVKLSKGIPSFFKDMKEYVRRKYGKKGISLGIYVVSAGLEEIIKGTPIGGRYAKGRFVDDIFGCRFAHDSDGVICFPQSTVSYTEKTKFVFAINKGLSSKDLARDPYCVNDHVPPHERKVPLANMMYIGDGPSDVACMSLLKKAGCEIFAVYTEPRQGIPKKTYGLASQGRFTRGPYKRNYNQGSDLRRALEGEINGYAERILGEMKATGKTPVRH